LWGDLGTKVYEVLHEGIAWGVRILIKNKLQNLSVIRETNLLSLINLSSAHVTVALHGQIMD
jgi:hypothetical protein